MAVRSQRTLTAIHFDLAPMSQRTSALGQWATAFCSRASRDSLGGGGGRAREREGEEGEGEGEGEGETNAAFFSKAVRLEVMVTMAIPSLHSAGWYAKLCLSSYNKM